MHISLSLLAVALGLLLILTNLYALVRPAKFAEAARKFPRSLPLGYFFMLLGTVWFVSYVKQESIADFESMKPYLYALFIGVGVGSCIFVKDFLAVRGLAVVMLLLAKLMVDTGRPHLGETPWVLLIQVWAYILVLAGVFFTVSPWRFREVLNWSVADAKRLKVMSGVRLAFGLLVAILGVTVFRH